MVTQLEVLRTIQERIDDTKFVKLELGGAAAGAGQSQIVVFLSSIVFPFTVDDGEWDNPQPLIEQIVDHIEANT